MSQEKNLSVISEAGVCPPPCPKYVKLDPVQSRVNYLNLLSPCFWCFSGTSCQTISILSYCLSGAGLLLWSGGDDWVNMDIILCVGVSTNYILQTSQPAQQSIMVQLTPARSPPRSSRQINWNYFNSKLNWLHSHPSRWAATTCRRGSCDGKIVVELRFLPWQHAPGTRQNRTEKLVQNFDWRGTFCCILLVSDVPTLMGLF